MTRPSAPKTRSWRHPVHRCRAGVALVTVAISVATIAMAARPSERHQASGPDRSMAAALTALKQIAAAAPTSAGSPGAATTGCQPPPPPAPTYPGSPPGAGYGVPFVARLTDGVIVGGYDQQWAAGHFDPWKARIFDINGWVAGLLQVPSLTGQVDATGIVFCTKGTPIYFAFRQGESRPTPPALTNQTGVAHTLYLPIVASLNPVGRARLSVAGVEPNGSLDLSGSASGAITLAYHTTLVHQTCTQYAPNTINLSTQVAPEPPSGPPGVGLIPAFTPKAVAGPLAHAAGIVASNDFAVIAFDPTRGDCQLAALLNAEIAGTNARGQLNSPSPCCPIVASPPGWTQFSAKVRITYVGLPVGEPPGFGF